MVSGINNGANMGDDTIYSGTVARGDGRLPVRHSGDRVLAGAKGLGASSTRPARVARSVIEHVLREPPDGAHWLLNVNIPNRADADTLPRRDHAASAAAMRASR